jgi:hypothetical protein
LFLEESQGVPKAVSPKGVSRSEIVLAIFLVKSDPDSQRSHWL